MTAMEELSVKTCFMIVLGTTLISKKHYSIFNKTLHIKETPGTDDNKTLDVWICTADKKSDCCA